MFLAHLLPLILLLFGLGLLAGAGVSCRRTVRFLQGAMEALGEVVEMREVRDSDGSSWMPVAEFTAPSGERVRFEAKVCSNPPKYKSGDRVTVYYNPQNVREARIKSFIYLWLLPLLLGLMGAAFTWIGAGQLLGVIPTR